MLSNEFAIRLLAHFLNRRKKSNYDCADIVLIRSHVTARAYWYDFWRAHHTLRPSQCLPWRALSCECARLRRLWSLAILGCGPCGRGLRRAAHLFCESSGALVAQAARASHAIRRHAMRRAASGAGGGEPHSLTMSHMCNERWRRGRAQAIRPDSTAPRCWRVDEHSMHGHLVGRALVRVLMTTKKIRSIVEVVVHAGESIKLAPSARATKADDSR